MDDMNALERQLADVVRGAMRPPRPVDAAAVAHTAMSTTASGRWSVLTRAIRGGMLAPSEGGFSMFDAPKFVAAGVVVALFGGFLLAGVLTAPPEDESHPAAVTESPTPTPVSDPISHDDPLQPVAGPGPWLVWERAPELDEMMAEFYERFYGEASGVLLPQDIPASVLTYEHGGYVLAVADGDATRSRPHGLLDGYQPLRLWVISPDGDVEAHVIDRAYRVRNVAIGPAGIFVTTAKAAADRGVEQLALAGRFRIGERTPKCCRLQPDGTVTTDGSGGLPRVVRFGQYRGMLERIGLRRADLAGPRHWLWRDGAGWTEIEAPPEDGRVVATHDGYFALGKDGRLHFTEDLLSWDVIAEAPRRSGRMWARLELLGDRLLYVAEDEIAWVAPDGLEPTPFGQAVDEAGPIRSLGDPWLARLLPWPGSEDGLVLIHAASHSALFTPDGHAWGLAPLGAPMGRGTEFAIRDGQLVQSSPLGSDGPVLAYRAVVTDERPG